MNGTYPGLDLSDVPDVVATVAWIDADHGAALGLGALTVWGVLLVVQKRFTQGQPESGASSSRQLERISDQDQVHRLLQANDGAMKQSEIVNSVDWSKAKVSRLLSDLEANGEIQRISLGRENLVFLPGTEPTAVK